MGTHQIQRILQNEDTSFETYINLRNYLGNSTQLQKQATYLFNGKVHSNHGIEKAVNDICRIKKIEDQNFKNKLLKIMTNANCLTKYKNDLSLLYGEKVDNNNESQIQMLFDIYKKFFPNDIDIKINDKKWLNIGFQGKDPFTDFRGSGNLGLKHLWSFSLQDPRALDVFKIATGEKTWYFYAATGINISGKVIQFIEESICDKYFYNHPRDINLYKFSQILYNEFFVGFNNLWIKEKCTDFMKVNTLLEYFMEHNANPIFISLIKKASKYGY